MAFTLHVTAGPSAGSIVADVRRQPRLSVVASDSRGCLTGRSIARCSAVGPSAAYPNHGQEGMLHVEHNQKHREDVGPRFKQGSFPPSRRRGDSASLLLDSWDPFSARSIRQMMDMMDSLFFDAALPGSTVKGIGGRRVRTPWDVAEDEEAFHVRVDMPGFGKDEVKVTVEDGVLVIKGDRNPEGKGNDRWAAKAYQNFSTRMSLPENIQHDGIKAELKHGVLNLTIPKIKPEDRTQVIDVQVG